MKHLKTLGLTAIAALGLTAFVGTGTASATTLSTDSAGTAKYANGTTFHATLATGASMLWEKTNGERIATCTESTIHGTIGTATGTWVTINIGTLTWGGCNQTTVSIENAGGGFGSLEFMQTTGDAAEVVGRESNVTQSVFGVTCTYGTAGGTRLGTISGGAAPELSINTIIPRTAGNTVLCPSTSRWTLRYIITSPHEVHFVS